MTEELDTLVLEVYSLQFCDNTADEAQAVREDAVDLVKRSHAAGAAAERARVVALIEAELAKRPRYLLVDEKRDAFNSLLDKVCAQ